MPAFSKPDFKYRPELHRLLRKKAFGDRKSPAGARGDGAHHRPETRVAAADHTDRSKGVEI